MVRVFKCSKCGHFASSDSPVCRHCGDDPRPSHTICKSCEKPLSISEAANGMHDHCWSDLNDKPDLRWFSCPSCDRILNYVDAVDGGRIVCSGCGRIIPLDKCGFCDRPLARKDSVRLWFLDETNRERHQYFHKSCGEVVIYKRARAGLCESCGRDLENIQSFTNFARGIKVCLFCESRRRPVRRPGIAALQPAKRT